MSDFSTARQKMVDGQVRPSDVTDQRILDAMLAVPREVFVPPSQQALAYLDLDLEIGEPGTTKRCLMKPVVLARMLQAAGITATDSVLVVGCATGYSAAVLSRLAARVTATDTDASNQAKVAAVLTGQGCQNAEVVVSAPSAGYPANAPYDVIVIAGATEVVPRELYRQLRSGGRLVGVFATGQPQRAMIVTHSHDDFGTRALFDAAVPVVPGFERAAEFVF